MKSSITSLENSQPSADRNSIMSTMIPEISLDAPSPLDTGPVPSGVASPDPLLGPASRRDHGPIDRKALAKALRQSPLQRPSHDITDRDEVMPDPMLELSVIRSRRAESFAGHRGPSHAGLEGEAGSPTDPISQGVPPELSNFLAEIIFVAVCSAGQIVFSLTYGHATVAQFPLRDALGISASQAPWLVGSSLLASGLSVIIAGSLADLAPPKPLMVGAFLWQAAWNAVMAGVIRPELRVLFFVARAMQGLSVGILVSASMSILGRVYKPGLRKTRVFSAMAGASPLGFWIGCLQGGALSAHLPWIFGTTAIFLGLCAVAAQLTLPDLSPAKDSADADAPSLKNFDYLGAVLSSVGCGECSSPFLYLFD